MKILAIYTAFPTTVSIYIDGKIIAAVQEERFTRYKNDDSYPINSIDYCLREANIEAKDLDAVAIASFIGFSYSDTLVRRSTYTTQDYLKEQYQKWLPLIEKKGSKSKTTLEIFPEKIDFNSYPLNALDEFYSNPNREKEFHEYRKTITAKYLGICEEKIHFIEHHKCHAAYSYYASNFADENILAFTVDGYGDGLNATIGIFDSNGNYTRKYQTSECNIGRIYRYMTLLLGMKPNEHEYKVMGLAPYGKKEHSQKALDIFRSTLFVDGIEFKWKEKPTDSYFWFKERLEGIRFDNIAYALQEWVEELLTQWIKNAINKFNINKIVISGGVAMNIKAMGKIANLKEVDDLFIGGSASDESLSIGAAICLAKDLESLKKKSLFNGKDIINNLYLGPSYTREEEFNEIQKLDENLFKVYNKPTNKKVAKLLSEGLIIARCKDRMEFGQRALGNRSILANPKDSDVIQRINSAIKNRDFWMPFAPIILDKNVPIYLKNPKNIHSPYMTIGFETTKTGYKSMRAACHPADKSARPQMLKKASNEDLYDLILEFEKITGIGALLNTSFNLHGSPIVSNVIEAIEVFIRSGLNGLLLNNYLILKINNPFEDN